MTDEDLAKLARALWTGLAACQLLGSAATQQEELEEALELVAEERRARHAINSLL